MSIFRYLYDFVQRGGPPRKLNHSESSECKTFVGICSDASPEGFGICELESDFVSARALGKWQERWRFRRLAPEEWKPRQRSSGWDPLGDVRTAKGSLAEFDDLDNYIENEVFPEVPLELMIPEKWKTVSMGKWKHGHEHITLKEGRSLVLAVRRMTRASQQRGLKHVVLLDNLSLRFAVGKVGATISSCFALFRSWVLCAFPLAFSSVPAGFDPRLMLRTDHREGNSVRVLIKKIGALVRDTSRTARTPKAVQVVKKRMGVVRSLTSKASWPQFSGEEEGPKENFECWPVPSQASESQEGRQSYPQRAGGRCGNQGKAESPGAWVQRFQHQYQGYFSKFEDFCKLNGVGFPISPLDADPLLADFLDLLYLDGKSAREGEKTVAALEFHQIALKGHLPRSKRALRGWRKSRPAFQQIANAQTCYVRSSHELARREQNGHGSIGAGGFSPLLAPGRRTGPEKDECSFLPSVRQANSSSTSRWSFETRRMAAQTKLLCSTTACHWTTRG